MTTPADPPVEPPVFPSDDSLCERCGYPLKGLASDAACPECGSSITDSSPAKRMDLLDESRHHLGSFLGTVINVLTRPRDCFRRLRVDPGHDSPRAFLTRSCFFASVIWSLAFCYLDGVFGNGQSFYIGFVFLGIQFILMLLLLHALTYIEMLGVTTFSRRRGWRVPFHLAQRVCCYASVAWLPGIVIAAIGFGLLQEHGVGHRWFEQFLGLVRVGWIMYATLFVLSLLWFETLVWIGVRQVRYANAWPIPADQANEPTPDDAPES